MPLPQHLERWFIGRGLRGRLVATLCAVLVPAILIAILWTHNEYAALRGLRLHNSEQNVVLAAAQVTGLLAQAQVLGEAYLEAAGGKPGGDGEDGPARLAGLCPGFAGLGSAIRIGVNALALFQDGKPICSAGPGSFDASRAATLLAVPAVSRLLIGGAGERIGMAVMPSPGTDGAGQPASNKPPTELLLGWNLSGQPGLLVILGLPAAALSPSLDPAFFLRGEGVALIDAGGRVLAERHSAADAGDWLTPAAAATSHMDVASFDMNDAGGAAEHYIVVPIAGTATRLLVGYAGDAFFAPLQQQFWLMVLELVGLATATIAAGVFAVDRTIGQWVGYFRRIAIAHSRGRLSVRARRLDSAPTELADLGMAVNRMADNMAGHARMLEASLAERAVLWQELQHRVKNNFQVIASLLNLYKKSLPEDRRQDIRFVEDHVQSMAIAYRVAYASNENTRVPPAQLAREVIAALGDIGGVPPEKVLTDSGRDETFIDLDKAIAFGLYLAYFLPPRLDALTKRSPPLHIGIEVAGDYLTMRFTALPDALEPVSALRQRLLDAYIRQLRAEISQEGGVAILRLPLYSPVSSVVAPVPKLVVKPIVKV